MGSPYNGSHTTSLGAMLLLCKVCFMGFLQSWPPHPPGALYVDKHLLLGKCFELSVAHFCVLTTAFVWAGPGASYSCPKSIEGTQPSGLVTRVILGVRVYYLAFSFIT